MGKEKTYKRFILCSQTVTYKQEVHLTKEELALLESADDLDICQYTSNIDNRRAYELIEGWIDPNDIFDADQEFTNFELLKK